MPITHPHQIERGSHYPRGMKLGRTRLSGGGSVAELLGVQDESGLALWGGGVDWLLDNRCRSSDGRAVVWLGSCSTARRAGAPSAYCLECGAGQGFDALAHLLELGGGVYELALQGLKFVGRVDRRWFGVADGGGQVVHGVMAADVAAKAQQVDQFELVEMRP